MNNRFSDLNARISDMDRNLSGRMDRMESHFNSRLDSVDTKIEMLTGSYNEIDKRLGLMEDRQQRP